MEAYREVIVPKGPSHCITIPDWAIGRNVEVIVIPVTDGKESQIQHARKDHVKSPLAALGFAKRFRETRSTNEWMQEIREGELS
jgi:hypothetical protein